MLLHTNHLHSSGSNILTTIAKARKMIIHHNIHSVIFISPPRHSFINGVKGSANEPRLWHDLCASGLRLGEGGFRSIIPWVRLTYRQYTAWVRLTYRQYTAWVRNPGSA